MIELKVKNSWLDISTNPHDRPCPGIASYSLRLLDGPQELMDSYGDSVKVRCVDAIYDANHRYRPNSVGVCINASEAGVYLIFENDVEATEFKLKHWDDYD